MTDQFNLLAKYTHRLMEIVNVGGQVHIQMTNGKFLGIYDPSQSRWRDPWSAWKPGTIHDALARAKELVPKSIR